MAIKIGMEIRQYAVITVDTEDLEEGYRMAEEAFMNESADLDMNAPTIDSMEFLSYVESLSSLSDQAYEARRAEQLFGVN